MTLKYKISKSGRFQKDFAVFIPILFLFCTRNESLNEGNKIVQNVIDEIIDSAV